jgi:hypothetical protein
VLAYLLAERPCALPCSALCHAAGWRALVRLASQAALVVTEDLPVPPDSDWLQVRVASPGDKLPSDSSGFASLNVRRR